MTAVLLVLAGLALAVPRARRPLAGRHGVPGPEAARTAGRARAIVAAVGVGLGLVTLDPSPLMIVVSAGAAAVVVAAIGNDRSGRSPPARTALDPLALELFAAALRSGSTVPTAARAVAVTLDGPDRERLARVATLVQLGADPGEAWAEFSGGDVRATVAAMVTRAGRSGIRLAEVIERQAEQVRAAAVATGTRRAHRVGALALVPLGTCFLPAFICLGVIPMVAGLAGHALR